MRPNELAQRMVQVGNFNKLAQMRQQAFYADATFAAGACTASGLWPSASA